MISRIQVVTVYVSDLDRSIPFYRDALGFEVVADWHGDDGDRMVFLLPPGAETELGLYAPGKDDPRIGVASGIVFTSPDVRATLAEMKQRDVEIVRDLVMHDYGDGDRPDDTGDLEFEFADPDGNRFLVHS